VASSTPRFTFSSRQRHPSFANGTRDRPTVRNRLFSRCRHYTPWLWSPQDLLWVHREDEVQHPDEQPDGGER